MYTTDAGGSWTDITPSAEQAQGMGMVDVVFGASSTDLWVAYGGRQDRVKVLHSDDAGQTWRSISAGLPTLAVRCLVYQEGADDRLYAGTEDGVYTRRSDDPSWQRYGDDLPFTSVAFLHIDEVDGLLQAGTERGIWQTSLAEESRPVARIARDRSTLRCTRTPVRFSDRSVCVTTMQSSRFWRFPGGVPETSTDPFVDVTYNQPGVYEARLIVTNGRTSDTTILESAVTVLPSECDGADTEPGLAIDLSGDDDYTRLGRLDTTISAFTFMAWVKPHGSQPDFSAIFCTEGPGNPQEVGMQFFAPDNQIGYLWSGGRWWWKSGLSLQPDRWSHVAMMVNEKGATVMVNGQAATDSIALGEIDLSSLDVLLGTYHFWESRNASIEIDEVRMYDRALTVDEVRRSMHHPTSTTEPGLLAWYQFNESGGLDLYDKHQGAPGHLERGADRRASTIPYGSGTTQILEALPPTWVAFEQTGIDLSLSSAIDAELMTTRILRRPDSLLTSQTLLGGYWLVRALSDSGDNINSLRASLRGQIGWEDGSSRRYHMWMREVDDHRAVWTDEPSLPTSPPSYDPRSQTIRGWLTKSIPASFQVAFTVEGGPVSVEEQQQHAASIAPLPASDRLVVTTQHPASSIALRDMNGRILEVHIDQAGSSTVLNVSQLPPGTYLLCVGDERHLVPIIR